MFYRQEGEPGAGRGPEVGGHGPVAAVLGGRAPAPSQRLPRLSARPQGREHHHPVS